MARCGCFGKKKLSKKELSKKNEKINLVGENSSEQHIVSPIQEDNLELNKGKNLLKENPLEKNVLGTSISKEANITDAKPESPSGKSVTTSQDEDKLLKLPVEKDKKSRKLFSKTSSAKNKKETKLDPLPEGFTSTQEQDNQKKPKEKDNKKSKKDTPKASSIKEAKETKAKSSSEGSSKCQEIDNVKEPTEKFEKAMNNTSSSEIVYIKETKTDSNSQKSKTLQEEEPVKKTTENFPQKEIVVQNAPNSLEVNRIEAKAPPSTVPSANNSQEKAIPTKPIQRIYKSIPHGEITPKSDFPSKEYVANRQKEANLRKTNETNQDLNSKIEVTSTSPGDAFQKIIDECSNNLLQKWGDMDNSSEIEDKKSIETRL